MSAVDEIVSCHHATDGSAGVCVLYLVHLCDMLRANVCVACKFAYALFFGISVRDHPAFHIAITVTRSPLLPYISSSISLTLIPALPIVSLSFPSAEQVWICVCLLSSLSIATRPQIAVLVAYGQRPRQRLGWQHET